MDVMTTMFKSATNMRPLRSMVVRHCSSKLKEKIKHINFVQQIFNKEESAKILDVLNNETEDQLKVRRLGTTRVQDLIMENRPFKSLTEVLSLPRLNIVQMEKLCICSLTDDKRDRGASIFTNRGCYPSVSVEKAKSIRTVTSLVLHHKEASFVTMTDKLEFLQARKLPYEKELKLLQYDHIKQITAIEDVIRQLPVSDVYLLSHEAIRLAGKTPLAVAYYGGRRVIDATFCSLMAGQNHPGDVHTLRTPLITSLFNLNVGGEMVKTRIVLGEIIEAGQWKGHVIKELDMLKHQHKYFDEHQCFLTLQCLAFITQILQPLRQPAKQVIMPQEQPHPSMSEVACSHT